MELRAASSCRWRADLRKQGKEVYSSEQYLLPGLPRARSLNRTMIWNIVISPALQPSPGCGARLGVADDDGGEGHDELRDVGEGAEHELRHPLPGLLAVGRPELVNLGVDW